MSSGNYNEDQGQQINDLNMKLFKSEQERQSLATEVDNLNKQNKKLQGDYQTYVEKLQKQVENLVDQINLMTDEREDAFAKIENLDKKLKGL